MAKEELKKETHEVFAEFCYRIKEAMNDYPTMYNCCAIYKVCTKTHTVEFNYLVGSLRIMGFTIYQFRYNKCESVECNIEKCISMLLLNIRRNIRDNTKEIIKEVNKEN